MILPLTCLAVLLISYGAHCLDLNTPIEHSLDGKHFTIAGSLQGSLFDLGVSRGEQLTLLRKDMTSQEQQALAELVRNDGQATALLTITDDSIPLFTLVYKLRLSADPSRKDSPKLLTSIPAKCLVSSGLQDHLQLHATSSGNFVGLNYDYARHPCLAGTEVALPGDLNFPESSSVPVWLPVAASITQKAQPAPAAGSKGAGARSGQPASGGAAKGGKAGEGEPPVEDTRPWLVKNWMIALPLAFVAINIAGAVMGPQEAPAPAEPRGPAPVLAGARRR